VIAHFCVETDVTAISLQRFDERFCRAVSSKFDIMRLGPLEHITVNAVKKIFDLVFAFLLRAIH
jgi:hypothetical protein